MNRTGDLDEDQRSTRGTGWQKKLLAVEIIDMPVTVIAFGRFLFAWLALLAGRALWGRAASNEAEGFRRTLILIGCNTAATLLCFMAAFRFVPVTNAVLLAFSYPVIAAFLAHRFLGERILGVALGALVLSAAGAALITLPEAGGAQIGAWWRRRRPC